MTGSYTTTNYREDGVDNINGTLKINGVAIVATATEINQASKTSLKVGISAGSTLAVTTALHNGATINLDTATGSVCTLPAATGSRRGNSNSWSPCWPRRTRTRCRSPTPWTS